MPDLTPLTGTIGAQVHGVNLAAAQDQATIDWINAALVEHKVLFFRDQDLDRKSHIAFGRYFGDLEVHPFAKHISAFNTGADDPEVIVIESRSKGENKGTDMWHSDVTWRAEPSLGSILRCLKSPAAGGDTMWANMEEAYERLDDETKTRIEHLEAEHDWEGFRNGLRRGGVAESLIDEMNAEFPLAMHPVVRRHPVSGRKCIYVNRIFTKRIVGLEPEESEALLEKLYRQATLPEVQVRFRWEPGSVAFWDNRSTQHYAVGDYGDAHRLMERVTVAGDRPF